MSDTETPREEEDDGKDDKSAQEEEGPGFADSEEDSQKDVAKEEAVAEKEEWDEKKVDSEEDSQKDVAKEEAVTEKEEETEDEKKVDSEEDSQKDVMEEEKAVAEKEEEEDEKKVDSEEDEEGNKDGATDGEDDATQREANEEPYDSQNDSTRDAEPTRDEDESDYENDEEKEEETNKIPEDFYYDIEPLLCTPFRSATCHIKSSIMELYHSFGYNCRMRCNLHMLDPNTLVFAAGAVLQFVDITTKEYTYLKTLGGGSYGPIAVNYKQSVFAAAEKGQNPVISIFSISDIRLYRLLRGGALYTFASLSFNEEGNLLASQGGEPDYMLTIWNWAQEVSLLRCRAFAQEVYNVGFNKDLPGLLTTSGSGHIKFWRMARTFTGLKLQGIVGRFGRCSMSDIEGFLQFPDGKVLSGSEWGNLLLWDESLIKLQICRKHNKPCHNGQIYHMVLEEDEILTAGHDGYVRSWNMEHVDQAQAEEQGGTVEVEPMNELLIGPDVQIMYLTRCVQFLVPPSEHAKQDQPQEHARQDQPQEHARQDQPQEHARQDQPQEHARQDQPQEHARQDQPQEHARQDQPQEHARQDQPQEHARQDQPQEHSRPDRPEEHARQHQPQEHGRLDQPDEHPRLDQPEEHARHDRPDEHARQDLAQEHGRLDQPDEHPRLDQPEEHARHDRPDEHARQDLAQEHARLDQPEEHPRLDQPEEHVRHDRPDEHARQDLAQEHARLDLPDGHARQDQPQEHPRLDLPEEHPRQGRGSFRHFSVLSMSMSMDERLWGSWYVQDGAGAIWCADLSFRPTAATPRCLLNFHAGPIAGCAVSPLTYLAVSLGSDGSVRLQDFLRKKVLATKNFKSAGLCLTWIPLAVDIKCISVLAGFADGCIRRMVIESHTRAIKGQEQMNSNLRLAQALRPHVKPVTAVAYSPKGKYLATCSKDMTVFLFHVSREDYAPQCFVVVPYVPRKIEWLEDEGTSLHILVTCDEGVVLSLKTPRWGRANTKESLKLDEAEVRQFKFMSVKSRILHEEEEEIKRQEEEKRRLIEDEADKKKIASGLETVSQQNLRKEVEAAERVANAGPPPPKWEPYIPPVPNPILETVYCENTGKFWLSLAGYDAGYFYECEIPQDERGDPGSSECCEPLRAVVVPNTDDVPITSIRFNSDGTYAFYGFQNGRIRLVFLESEFDLTSQDCYCVINAHDTTVGAVTSIKLSHDETFLLTIGADGNFFIFNILPLSQLTEQIKIKRAKLPPVVARIPDAPDVEEDGYTIEEAKNKTEHDAMLRRVEAKKQNAREKLAQLRSRFQQLLHDNEALPPRFRLDRSEFLMSAQRVQEIHEDIFAKENQVRKEMAWSNEKVRLSFHKVYDHYKATLVQDLFRVRAFTSDHVIHSYRVDEDLKYTRLIQEVAEAERLFTEGEEGHDRSSGISSSEEESEVTADGEEEEDMSKWEGASIRVLANLRKAKVNRKKRALRQQVWRKFLKSKPADDYEDPADVLAIQVARETMGYFPLKTDPQYEVPPSYKLSVLAGNRRLADCICRIRGLQDSFNERLLALREHKVALTAELKELSAQLAEIHSVLPRERRLPIPEVKKMTEEEEPERRFAYTRETLTGFQHWFRRESQDKSLLPPERVKRASRLGSKRISTLPLSYFQPRHKESVVAERTRSSVDFSWLDSSTDDWGDLSSVFMTPVPLSRLQEQQLEEEAIRLEYEQKLLVNLMTDKMARFDVAHRIQRHEKIYLDVILKLADLRVNDLVEENIILKTCEAVEQELQSQTSAQLALKSDLDKKQKQLTEAADKLTKELEKFGKQEKSLLSEVEESIGEKNPFYDYLVKVYKKKIKRKKKKKPLEGTEEEEEAEEEEESSSSEESSDEEEEEDEEEGATLDLSVCPQACSRQIFDRIVELREKRLDNEEDKMEVKSARDALFKELEVTKKKAFVNAQDVEKQKKACQGFEVEKQRKMNELCGVALLHLHQLQCLENEHMPGNLDNQLVINEDSVIHLTERIHELKKEKKIARHHTHGCRRRYRRLTYQRTADLAKLEAMTEACDQAMLGKLGRVVEMEVLDLVVADPELEGLRCALLAHRKKCEAELAKLDHHIAELQRSRAKCLRLGTEQCYVQATMLSQSAELEADLDHMIQTMHSGCFEDESLLMGKDIQELKVIVAQQRMAIAALHQQIALLRGSQQRASSNHHPSSHYR